MSLYPLEALVASQMTNTPVVRVIATYQKDIHRLMAKNQRWLNGPERAEQDRLDERFHNLQRGLHSDFL